MPDIFSKQKRSEVMAKITSKNTTLESDFCEALSREVYPLGLRYRRNDAGRKGKPDVVFPKFRIALFLDGCFWHGCPQHYSSPKTHKKYWLPKIAANQARDRRVTRHYRREGWTVLRAWEHEARKAPEKIVEKILSAMAACWKRERAHAFGTLCAPPFALPCRSAVWWPEKAARTFSPMLLPGGSRFSA